MAFEATCVAYVLIDICQNAAILLLHINSEKAREVEISTSNFGLNSAAVLIPGEEDGSKTIAGSGRQLAYLPSVSATYSIFYKRRWMQISRTQGQTGYYGRTEDTLQIRWVVPLRPAGGSRELLLN